MTWRDDLRERSDVSNITVGQVDLIELLDIADDFDRFLVATIQVLDTETYDKIMSTVGEMRGDPRLSHILDLLSRSRRLEPI